MTKTQSLAKFEFKEIGSGSGIASVTLSRPEVRNALNLPLLKDLLTSFEQIRSLGTRCRLVLIRGEGGNFCSGADIAWMRAAADLAPKENAEESKWLLDTFQALYELPVPTLALAEGSVFGGGVGLLACCDWAVAKEGAQFCLPETRIGNLAASILPYLVAKMRPSQLRRWVMTGNRFSATEALDAGLVEKVVPESSFQSVVKAEVAGLLKGEPSAQFAFKRLHQRFFSPLIQEAAPSREELAQIFAERRTGALGREGFQAFLEKRSPHWALELPQDWAPDREG